MTNNMNNIKKSNARGRQKVKVFTKRKNKQTESELSAIKTLQEQYESIDPDNIKEFSDLPLSSQTQKGLKECGYKIPTEIQKRTILSCLTGKDVLGAAHTGSGKTLAFLVPILEKLYCEQWTRLDGIGALIITPTRELALQIHETLKCVGAYHNFSAGLIIGGKDLKFEWKTIDQFNIIICTPGRILQHMNANPLFDCSKMKILVLDEADRCLDITFQKSMNDIIPNLPPERQTLLFSATQTKFVKDLVRLSLKDPAYVSVYEHSEYRTPPNLKQHYVVCELKNKISILYSFIKNHSKKKIIIFFASCKQVKYVAEIFQKLKLGINVIALYGTLHQLRRMNIYDEFRGQSSAVLFATDIAARGLDFPEVDWVVQADCPEDVATYVHRAGRTARYYQSGQSLLLLLPSELQMLEYLKERKIPIEELEINQHRLKNPVTLMKMHLSKRLEFGEDARRALLSYVKSVALMKDKKVFDVKSLDIKSFAFSLGLIDIPRIRFLDRLNAKANKSMSTEKTSNNKICFNDEGKDKETEKHNELDSEDSEECNEGVNKKTKNLSVDLPTNLYPEESARTVSRKPLTKAALARKLLKMKTAPNKKIVFSDENEAVDVGPESEKSQMSQQVEDEDEGGIGFDKIEFLYKEKDKLDRRLYHERVKAKHKEERRKLKANKNKKKDESDESESEESESEEEPDLSWLPDPNQIYDKRDVDSDDYEGSEKLSSDEDFTETEEPAEREKKTKRMVRANKSKGSHVEGEYEKIRNQKLKSRQREKLDVDESLDETEELTQALKKSKKRKPKADESPKGSSKKKTKKEKLKEIGESLDINEAEQLAIMLLKNK